MRMREHAILGYQMLRKIRFLHESTQIVYSHQERYDGSGYPRGLKGDQIPIGARIFAVADTFDAITSDRRYRAAQSIPAARREINKHSGHQFDPQWSRRSCRSPTNCGSKSAMKPTLWTFGQRPQAEVVSHVLPHWRVDLPI
jgi:HD-GYP domain-containing protein (c-di-GMP phosphodiesterase class II)